jgi:hypothetical protein
MVSNNISSNTVQLIHLILILIILFLLITFPYLRSILCVISGFRREVFEICALLGITTVRCVISQKSINILGLLFIYAVTKKSTGKYSSTRIVKRERSEKTDKTVVSKQMGENKSGLEAKTEPKPMR